MVTDSPSTGSTAMTLTQRSWFHLPLLMYQGVDRSDLKRAILTRSGQLSSVQYHFQIKATVFFVQINGPIVSYNGRLIMQWDTVKPQSSGSRDQDHALNGLRLNFILLLNHFASYSYYHPCCVSGISIFFKGLPTRTSLKTFLKFALF